MIYEPREDSYLMASVLRKFVKDKSVLDVGSGSGILAQNAIKSGAKSVIASDIDKDSIELLKSKGLFVVQSDLFSDIEGNFDVIAFNPPYLPEDKREDALSAKATTGGEKGDEIILSFLEGASNHLNPQGIILLLVSSLTPLNRIKTLMKRNGLEYEVLASESFFFEELFVWKIHRN